MNHRPHSGSHRSRHSSQRGHGIPEAQVQGRGHSRSSQRHGSPRSSSSMGGRQGGPVGRVNSSQLAIPADRRGPSSGHGARGAPVGHLGGGTSRSSSSRSARSAPPAGGRSVEGPPQGSGSRPYSARSQQKIYGLEKENAHLREDLRNREARRGSGHAGSSSSRHGDSSSSRHGGSSSSRHVPSAGSRVVNAINEMGGRAHASKDGRGGVNVNIMHHRPPPPWAYYPPPPRFFFRGPYF